MAADSRDVILQAIFCQTGEPRTEATPGFAGAGQTFVRVLFCLLMCLLAALGLPCHTQAFSSCGARTSEQRLLLLWSTGSRRTGSVAGGMGNPPGPGTEPTLAGGLSAAGPPEKSGPGF